MSLVDRLPAPPLPQWLAAQLPGLDRYRVDVGGQRMHVMEAGAGRPVLMVHGCPTWGFLYRKVIAELRGEPLRLIAPDLIGLGFSDHPRDIGLHRLDAHMGWMGALVEQLDLQDVILVVQDWGGPVGTGAFLKQRHRLGGLVVMNTVLAPPKPGFKSTAFHRLGRLPVVSDVLFRGLGFPQRALWLAQGDKRSIRGQVARAYAYPLRKRRDNAAGLGLTRMVPDSLNHPSVEPLGRVAALVSQYDGPAAIVWGDKDPVLGGLKRRIASALPQAEVDSTDGGHFLQEEVPDRIAAAIRRVAGLA